MSTNSADLSPAQLRLLRAIAQGQSLKSHRDVEGHKVYQLHTLDKTPETVAWEVVETLQEVGLIASNQKFPAATFWLTEAGRRIISPSNYSD